jgi:hypothetical protein
MFWQFVGGIMHYGETTDSISFNQAEWRSIGYNESARNPEAQNIPEIIH